MGNVAVVPGTTITFHVWIPSGSKVTALQPYLQDNNWAWTSGWYPSLTANAWNTITLTVPTNAVSPLQNLGIQFITSAGWTGTCYIDSVSLDYAFAGLQSVGESNQPDREWRDERHEHGHGDCD